MLAGQPLALEMLFAPDAALTQAPTLLWREVQALAPRLASRQATAFLRYCRKQAELYGSKGARAATVRQALVALQEAEAEAVRGSTTKLSHVEAELAVLLAAVPLTTLVNLDVGGGRIVRHLDVCSRRVPIHATIKAAREMADRLLAEYGDRSLRAERDGGVDWKPLSHAVRVGQEALELLDTGWLRFPLAGAPHLLAIKSGHVPYDAVAAEIEDLLRAVEAAVTSTLPEHPDRDAAEALVLRAHRERIMAG